MIFLKLHGGCYELGRLTFPKEASVDVDLILKKNEPHISFKNSLGITLKLTR